VLGVSSVLFVTSALVSFLASAVLIVGNEDDEVEALATVEDMFPGRKLAVAVMASQLEDIVVNGVQTVCRLC
jgi:hypothetical protein